MKSKCEDLQGRLDLAAAARRQDAVADDEEADRGEPHSRTSMTTVTHHGSSPRIDKPTRPRPSGLVGDRVGDLAEVGDQARGAARCRRRCGR